MQKGTPKSVLILLTLAAVSMMILPAGIVKAAGENGILDPIVFGWSGDDKFVSVIRVEEGFVAVGNSNSFGGGSWAGTTGKGGNDAIIVKFENEGTVKWARNFGGSGDDYFTSVIEVAGGYVAVGGSNAFGSGDWNTTAGKGGQDAVIVKYDTDGTVVWKKNFGGSGADHFTSVVEVSGEYVAVGYSAAFSSGDWTGNNGNGSVDAILVRFGADGGIVWAKNFGGSGWERFTSVTAVNDGIVAVGVSDMFRNDGDWSSTDVKEKGGVDAVIVKFSFSGTKIWARNFGGADIDYFYSVAAVPDGVVAVGVSWLSSFGSGDWSGVQSKGGSDAIIVKYSNSGDVRWKKNFGGAGTDYFSSVTAVPGGVVAVGYSNGFGSGDWSGTAGKGNDDAVAVMFGSDGKATWKQSFGGAGIDQFNSVAAVPGGVIAAGFSSSFNNGDWTGMTGKGGNDATLVSFGVPVTDEEKGDASAFPLVAVVLVCIVIGAVIGLAFVIKIRGKKKTK